MNAATAMRAIATVPTEAQIEQYHRDGFLILRNVFLNSEIAELAGGAERIFKRKGLMDPDNIRCRWQDW